MMRLSERIEKVLEKYDFSVCTENSRRDDGVYEIELETYSPENENVIVPIVYDGTEDGFIREFRNCAENFNVEKHAEMWFEHRGEGGVPESIKDLLEDAEWIKSTLEKVADELENPHLSEKVKGKYKVDITETYKRTIEVEAESSDEAYEKVDEWINEGIIDLPCDGGGYDYERFFMVNKED